MNVILGVTGSVATTLTPRLVDSLMAQDCIVRVVATKSALHFFNPNKLNTSVYTDEDEWKDGKYHKESPILHIELRKWADVMLIAPLTANTLAKLATGITDNLLTSILRAWDRSQPIVLAPAMNTFMWEHPATDKHLSVLKHWYRATIVAPIDKTLACGDTGIGALANIDDIVRATIKR